LASRGGKATGGQRPEELLDGNDTDYTGGTGFAYTTWSLQPPQFFIVTLKDAATIDCIRILLWDRDEQRFYRYKLEISPDDTGKAWTVVADRTGEKEECRSWQTVRFKPQTVKQMRLTGTFNSANSGFHVVEFQASLGVPPSAAPVTPEVLDF
jgi:BTB/POZ domain-containing protein 9